MQSTTKQRADNAAQPKPAPLAATDTSEPLSLPSLRVKRPDDILTPAELANEYRISPRTLANWRAKGTGPKVFRFGLRAVRYKRADVEAFIAASDAAGVAA